MLFNSDQEALKSINVISFQNFEDPALQDKGRPVLLTEINPANRLYVISLKYNDFLFVGEGSKKKVLKVPVALNFLSKFPFIQLHTKILEQLYCIALANQREDKKLESENVRRYCRLQ